MTESPVVPVAEPSLWSTFKGLFAAATEVLDTVTIVASSGNDLAKALKSQTGIIRDTSENDAEMKRLDLNARIAARKAQLLAEAPIK